MAFNAKNYYWNLSTDITVTAENTNFLFNTPIDKDKSIMVFTEVNYSSDGVKTFNIDLSAENTSTDYVNSFSMEGAAIENYTISGNGTEKIITFYVRNNWHSGEVTWTLNNPAFTNSTYLEYNQTAKVVINRNYTTQGSNKLEIAVSIDSFEDKVSDSFDVRPLELEELNTLSESQSNCVSEMVVKNNLGSLQFFSWRFNTGVANLTNSQTLNVTGSNVFIYIASNYSSDGVYRTEAKINSTSYNDTQKGVIVI